MPSTHVPVLEVEYEDIREVTPATAVLWWRLGIEALPEHETMLLPTERLVVPDADHLVRSAKRLVKSIQHVGILQNPSVVVKAGADIHDTDATFEVIAGRRRVLAGNVSREVARKLVRLTQAQQERVVRLADAGEEVTAERVNDLLRAQINAGFVPIQSALVQGWSDQSPSHLPELSNLSPQRLLITPGSEEQARQVAFAGKESEQDMCPSTSTTSMTSLLAALHAFVQSPDYRTTPQAVQTLTQALEQELRLTLREALSSSQSDPTVQPQS